MGQYSRILYFLFLFLSLEFCSSSIPPFSANTTLQLCSHYDRLALIEFRNSFSLKSDDCPGSYPKTKSWEKGGDCCSWNGVTCDTVTGQVIGLDVSCSWLGGSLYSNNSLFRLLHLRKLNLAHNYFRDSTISPEFGQFKSLTHLNLSHSSFLGEIPSEISHLSNLASLDISSNALRIDDLPLQRLVQNCSLLKQLLFEGVDLSSIDTNSLMNLSSSLTDLTLNGCRLQGKFPSNILYLPHLRILDLSHNELLNIHLPRSNWSSPLQELHFNFVPFTGELPESIGNLNSLKQLTIVACNFTGSIPTSMGNLQQLTHFYGDGNNFNGSIPSSLTTLSKLEVLSIPNSKLVGPIPNFSNLSKLVKLDLYSNSLNGTIQSVLYNLPSSLHSLRLTDNQFTGPINEFQSQSLEGLGLGRNKLNGSVTRSIFNLVNLTWLDLSSNSFSDTLDASMFSKLQNLQFLDLSNNNLTGLLPSPVKVQTYLISNNNLTGQIPSVICNTNLRFLDLSNNGFSGTIPPCFRKMSQRLQVLNLRKNKFSGEIPDIFNEGCELISLHLNDNQLEGSLPRSLVNCQLLELLDLGNNRINDTFPHWLESRIGLQVLILKSNSFHGSIRDWKHYLCFSMLQIFDISNNKFSGPLPNRYFENLKAMMRTEEDSGDGEYLRVNMYPYQDFVVSVIMKGQEYQLVRIIVTFKIIDCSNNKFRGEIPDIIGKLIFLKGLNFSHNSIGGGILSSLGNLRNLEWLDLSLNMLTGKIPGQLTDLTFLSQINLSHNKFVGPIPRSPQLDTFDNSSYEGNSGLCGFPLSKSCGSNNGAPPQSQPLLGEEDDSGSGFDWNIIMMGYSSGLVMGLSLGYIVLVTGKPQWLVRLIEGRWLKQLKRPNQRQRRRKG
ncbi:receptor-like protein 9DC3 [Tripterygium wilfordii]|uniref:receptor-like protein 9DC3 n=1 Tax=Tripterygium wilfordii TaxID=458696 RepID=UPI0018F8071C|nr:receptor-like protein 9DC3 [Tripterygium wilfordii]